MIVLMIRIAVIREDVLILKPQAILVISASANLGTLEEFVKKVSFRCVLFIFVVFV